MTRMDYSGVARLLAAHSFVQLEGVKNGAIPPAPVALVDHCAIVMDIFEPSISGTRS